MANNIVILDSFSESETRQEKRERIVVEYVDVEYKTDFLVLQISRRDAQLLAGLGDGKSNCTRPMQNAGARLAKKLKDIGISPAR